MERGKGGRPTIPGSRHDRPVPLGITAKVMVERQARNPSTITYSLEITVLEALRGKHAWDRIRKEDIAGVDLISGFEYLMARIRLKYYPKARGLSEYEPYMVDENQFSAVSQNGKTLYVLPHITKQPDPSLIGSCVAINETREGWIVLQVPLNEREPLLSFDRDRTESRLTLRTARGLIWFKLYEEEQNGSRENR